MPAKAALVIDASTVPTTGPSVRTAQETSKWLAAASALLGTLLWIGPYLLRADLYDDDAAQHLFWLYRYADPALLPGDATARFFSLPSSAPWGWRSLYALLAPVVDVLLAAKLLAALLLLASVALGYRIGRAVNAQRDAALGGLLGALAVLWLVPQTADAITPLALQRSFALPLTLLALYGAVAGRWHWLGASWLLAALFYPVVVPVLGLAGAVVLALELVRTRRLPPYTAWNALAGVIAIAIALAAARLPADIGPAIGGHEAAAMPEFGADGRLRLHGATIVGTWFRNHLLGVGWAPATLLLVALAAALARLLPGAARVPRAAWILLGCGLALWALAQFVLFDLYLPNRHARWAIAGFAVVALACAGTELAARARDWLGRRNPRAARFATTVAALALVVASLLPSALRASATPHDPDLERAYAYLGTLPRTTLVAAHPDLADFVPLRAHRSVLASTETSLPFMRGYYAARVPRLRASLAAAYATRWEDVDAALAPYGVGVLLTGPVVWARTSYYQPFAAQVAAARERGAREGFVLREPDPARVLFRSGEVYVVRVAAPAARNTSARDSVKLNASPASDPAATASTGAAANAATHATRSP